jgi:hypothetical protein
MDVCNKRLALYECVAFKATLGMTKAQGFHVSAGNIKPSCEPILLASRHEVNIDGSLTGNAIQDLVQMPCPANSIEPKLRRSSDS